MLNVTIFVNGKQIDRADLPRYTINNGIINRTIKTVLSRSASLGERKSAEELRKRVI